jgi:hypothetical protein
MVNQCIFVALSIMPSQCIAPLSPIFEAQWNKNASQVALLVCFEDSLSKIGHTSDDF